MATTTTLSDEQIAEAITQRLREQSSRSYPNDGEFASSLELGVPQTRVKQVLGRLIRGRKIIRSRPQAEHPGDSDRPVTYRLASELVTG